MFKYASSIYNTNQEKKREDHKHYKNAILTNYFYCKIEGVTHYLREPVAPNGAETHVSDEKKSMVQLKKVTGKHMWQQI